MADVKLTALTALASASADDVMYIVDDPAGTPASKKITFSNVQGSISALGSTQIADGSVSNTEFQYINSLTSNAQTQLTALKTVTIGASVDGGGSAITTGKIKGFFTVPYAGTISGYNITVDSGTVTIKTWKIATGTAKPTSANSISTSGVSLSSGSAVRSSTVTDFTSTTVSVGDIFAFNIEAVATATELNFGLEITRT